MTLLYPDTSIFAKVLDVQGQSVIPGLVDGHTHPVWAGDRVHEFSMKVINELLNNNQVS